jgi:hypothetical protein
LPKTLFFNVSKKTFFFFFWVFVSTYHRSLKKENKKMLANWAKTFFLRKLMLAMGITYK